MALITEIGIFAAQTRDLKRKKKGVVGNGTEGGRG